MKKTLTLLLMLSVFLTGNARDEGDSLIVLVHIGIIMRCLIDSDRGR